MSQTPKTIKDWRKTIEREADYVDVKPYSHNIISLALGTIVKLGGVDEANRAIEDFGLEDLGWSKIAKEQK